jgi:hypothetical protein
LGAVAAFGAVDMLLRAPESWYRIVDSFFPVLFGTAGFFGAVVAFGTVDSFFPVLLGAVGFFGFASVFFALMVPAFMRMFLFLLFSFPVGCPVLL